MVCKRCGQDKPPECFTPRKGSSRLINPCKVCRAADMSEWRAANPTLLCERQRRWRAARRDKQNAYKRKYNKAHRAEKNARARTYKARKRGLSVQGTQKAINAFYRWAMNERTVKCYLCGKVVSRNDRQVDHVMPLSRGGLHEPSNLCVMHKRCNIKKSNKLPHDVGLLL